MKIGYVMLGLGVVGIGAYAAYQKWMKPKMTFESSDEDEFEEAPASKQTTVRPSVPTSIFPLKKWSRGPIVVALQKALNKNYGAALNPDGVLGPLTQAAIIAAGFPSVLFEDQYRKLLSGKKKNEEKPSGSPKPKSTHSFDPLKMSDNFHYVIREHKFDSVQRLLRQLKSTKDYAAVNRYFKSRPMYDGLRRTLVTGLFHKFRSDWGKKTLSSHLFRIGLKSTGSKWSLSGIDTGKSHIKTVKRATVWNNTKQSLKVPAGTILGALIGAKSGVVKFRTLDGKLLYTDATAVRYA